MLSLASSSSEHFHFSRSRKQPSTTLDHTSLPRQQPSQVCAEVPYIESWLNGMLILYVRGVANLAADKRSRNQITKNNSLAMAHINDLPNEILQHIFQHVYDDGNTFFATTRVAVSAAVCQRWFENCFEIYWQAEQRICSLCPKKGAAYEAWCRKTERERARPSRIMV